ncbi:MAG: hypothetical protein GY784_13220, partial [Gammaproteobacteria bacterium]|nr:hypothetical protein [Gammaproteobacteria bacterium]
MRKHVFQQADIANACGPGAYSRGLAYSEQGRVLQIEVAEEFEGFILLVATVGGSQMYAQDIGISYD